MRAHIEATVDILAENMAKLDCQMFTTDIFCLFVLISLILDLLGGRLVGYIIMFLAMKSSSV